MNHIKTYLAVVTAVGVALTLERSVNGDTADCVGMLLATAMVIVLPLIVQPNQAPRAAAAARPSEGDDAR
jgi:hypothetical protein